MIPGTSPGRPIAWRIVAGVALAVVGLVLVASRNPRGVVASAESAWFVATSVLAWKEDNTDG